MNGVDRRPARHTLANGCTVQVGPGVRKELSLLEWSYRVQLTECNSVGGQNQTDPQVQRALQYLCQNYHAKHIV